MKFRLDLLTRSPAVFSRALEAPHAPFRYEVPAFLNPLTLLLVLLAERGDDPNVWDDDFPTWGIGEASKQYQRSKLLSELLEALKEHGPYKRLEEVPSPFKFGSRKGKKGYALDLGRTDVDVLLALRHSQAWQTYGDGEARAAGLKLLEGLRGRGGQIDPALLASDCDGQTQVEPALRRWVGEIAQALSGPSLALSPLHDLIRDAQDGKAQAEAHRAHLQEKLDAAQSRIAADREREQALRAARDGALRAQGEAEARAEAFSRELTAAHRAREDALARGVELEGHVEALEHTLAEAHATQANLDTTIGSLSEERRGLCTELDRYREEASRGLVRYRYHSAFALLLGWGLGALSLFVMPSPSDPGARDADLSLAQSESGGSVEALGASLPLSPAALYAHGEGRYILDGRIHAILSAQQEALTGGDSARLRPEWRSDLRAALDAFESPAPPEGVEGLLSQGRAVWKRRVEENLLAALLYFKKARTLEEGRYRCEAWAGEADAYHLLSYYGFMPVALAEAGARDAVAILDHHRCMDAPASGAPIATLQAGLRANATAGWRAMVEGDLVASRGYFSAGEAIEGRLPKDRRDGWLHLWYSLLQVVNEDRLEAEAQCRRVEEAEGGGSKAAPVLAKCRADRRYQFDQSLLWTEPEGASPAEELRVALATTPGHQTRYWLVVMDLQIARAARLGLEDGPTKEEGDAALAEASLLLDAGEAVLAGHRDGTLHMLAGARACALALQGDPDGALAILEGLEMGLGRGEHFGVLSLAHGYGCLEAEWAQLRSLEWIEVDLKTRGGHIWLRRDGRFLHYGQGSPEVRRRYDKIRQDLGLRFPWH